NNYAFLDYKSHTVVEGPAKKNEQNNYSGCISRSVMPRESYWTSITASPNNIYSDILMSFATNRLVGTCTLTHLTGFSNTLLATRQKGWLQLANSHTLKCCMASLTMSRVVC
ncbi:MAG: hypothetical protein ACI943_002109, partial [Gammaproteobacteria bacterium]